MDNTVAVVAITAMLASFALPLMLVALILYYKHRRARMAHETITRLAEKGLPVPPELLEPPRRGYAGLSCALLVSAVILAVDTD